ncbi:MAG: hypothetical protein JW959_06305, partial [Pirellulales bacterium]|nr:hypothetical protein [Pirellulales bacterium]
AEAFYQSVASPYQLLIVGDPLCRPWAEIPKVGVAGIEPGSEVSGTLRLTPAAALPEGEQVERFELYVDGRRFDACLPGGRLTFDSGNFADGWHQLRVVAVGPPPIESQGRAIMPIRLANHERTIEARLDGQGPFGFDEPIVVVVRAPGAKGIVVLHGSRAVGKLSGEEGRIEIAPGTLGAGPVRLRVVGVGGDVRSNAAAEPLEFTIKPRPAAAH